MEMLIQIMIGLIAFVHLYIMWFEMFAWETKGKAIFKSFNKDLFAPTKVMAANQGLYNGFLAAGLIWTFFITDVLWKDYVALFFLGCIFIAGLYGALTADKKIIFVQTVPASIAILLILLDS